MNKLPQVTLAFWVMKIAATTLGETGGDLLAQTMHVGYLASSVILVGLFLVSLLAQLRAKELHPALYWTVILSTSTAGTTMSDFMNRTLGLGYANGALLLITALVTVFVIWKRSGRPFNVQTVNGLGGELLYWTAILISNTLGTSLGDFLADDSGLGFSGSALLISGLMALIVAAMKLPGISRTLLFWAAFVLTRPLGASAGDFISKPTSKGGLGYGTIGASAVLMAVLIGFIAYPYVRQFRTSGAARTGLRTDRRQWVMLVCRVPADRAHHDRALRRELRAAGAIALSQDVWMLPGVPTVEPLLAHLRQHPAAADGGLIVTVAAGRDDGSTALLEQLYQGARTDEWAAFRADCEAYLAEFDHPELAGRPPETALDTYEQSLFRLRLWYQHLRDRDDALPTPDAMRAEVQLKRCADRLDRYTQQASGTASPTSTGAPTPTPVGMATS
ncbi:hypothetical protein HC031_12925 [Planosporangium thailandense]|uniref:ChrB N-terminal domain-containing protein n=1 Tax=Planosporangium thailandense TaxID=765197 RepID=A0ABX0XZH6_9ACTN|nr:Chromate resistance protein ChrB [Planosporangium thailandense]NJC70610.1 hypothetical protein [Planosporangium thailandense]